MRTATKLNLFGRGLCALCFQGILAVVVGLVLALFGASIGGGIGVAVVRFLTGAAGITALAGGALVGVLAFWYAWIHGVRKEFRFGRHRLLRAVREPDAPAEREGLDAVRQLSQQLDLPTPVLGVRDTDVPLCYTVSEPTETTLVVSTGVLDRLSPAEREAVLAHELAHIANGDHRWMNWVLAPLLAAEELAATTDDDTDERDTGLVDDFQWVLAIARQLHAPVVAFWDRLYQFLILWGVVGSGVFSRGRELAADSAAARVTGDPAALASALSRLDGDAKTPPSADLREHSRSLDALSILPALDPSVERRSGLRASHPPTARRVERLEGLARELADGQS